MGATRLGSSCVALSACITSQKNLHKICDLLL